MHFQLSSNCLKHTFMVSMRCACECGRRTCGQRQIGWLNCPLGRQDPWVPSMKPCPGCTGRCMCRHLYGTAENVNQVGAAPLLAHKLLAQQLRAFSRNRQLLHAAHLQPKSAPSETLLVHAHSPVLLDVCVPHGYPCWRRPHQLVAKGPLPDGSIDSLIPADADSRRAHQLKWKRPTPPKQVHFLCIQHTQQRTRSTPGLCPGPILRTKLPTPKVACTSALKQARSTSSNTHHLQSPAGKHMGP